MLLAVEASAQITFQQVIGSAGTGNGEFDGPFGTAISTNGDLYVTDYKNHRVQVFSAAGDFKFAFGTEGTTDGAFKYPVDVAFDTAGDVYVLQNDRVQVFSADGVFKRKFNVNSGYGLAMDHAGYVFVICAFEIMKFNVEGQLQKRWGTSGKATGQFDNAYKGVVDRDGRLYTVELFNHRIQVFTGDGEFITSIGSEGSGDGQLKYPAGIALDQNPVRVTVDLYGKIFVSDHSNNRVQVFSKATNAITGFDNLEKTFGDESFILSAQSSASASITYSEVIDESTTGDVSIDGFVVVIHKAGIVKLRAYAGDDLETAGAMKDITLTIHKATQYIEFDPLPTKILGTGVLQLPATSTAGLDISYSSTNEAVATVEGNIITLVGAGQTTIVASQLGDDNYAAAESVEQVLTVQMITDAEVDELNVVTVHPNPTTDFLIVEGRDNGALHLMDGAGRSVMASSVSAGEAQVLDLRSLPVGVYYLKIGTGKASTFKRIVRK
jgi:hypothetical protein